MCLIENMTFSEVFSVKKNQKGINRHLMSFKVHVHVYIMIMQVLSCRIYTCTCTMYMNMKRIWKNKLHVYWCGQSTSYTNSQLQYMYMHTTVVNEITRTLRNTLAKEYYTGYGFNYTAILCKLRHSFSLCNYTTYRRTFSQSMDRFHAKTPFLEKNTKTIVHGFIKKWVSTFEVKK